MSQQQSSRDRGEGATHEVHERKRSVAAPALVVGAIAAVVGVSLLRRYEPLVSSGTTLSPGHAEQENESQGTFGPRDQVDEGAGVYFSPGLLSACRLGQPAARFSSGSVLLDDDDRAALSGLVECLTSGPLSGRKVEVVGEAVLRNPHEYELGLAQQRADAIASFLRDRGVPGDQVSSSSVGKPVGAAPAEGLVEVRPVP